MFIKIKQAEGCDRTENQQPGNQGGQPLVVSDETPALKNGQEKMEGNGKKQKDERND